MHPVIIVLKTTTRGCCIVHGGILFLKNPPTPLSTVMVNVGVCTVCVHVDMCSLVLNI